MSYIIENKHYAVEMEKNPGLSQEQIEIESGGAVVRVKNSMFNQTFIVNRSYATSPETEFPIRYGKPVITVMDKTTCSLKQEFTMTGGYGYFCIPHVHTDVNGEVITE